MKHPSTIDLKQCAKFGCDKVKTIDGKLVCEEVTELYRIAFACADVSLAETEDVVRRERFRCGFRLERMMERW
jgi:hypothetical protein